MVRTGPEAHQPRTSVRPGADPAEVALTCEVDGFARLDHRLTSGGYRRVLRRRSPPPPVESAGRPAPPGRGRLPAGPALSRPLGGGPHPLLPGAGRRWP